MNRGRSGIHNIGAKRIGRGRMSNFLRRRDLDQRKVASDAAAYSQSNFIDPVKANREVKMAIDDILARQARKINNFGIGHGHYDSPEFLHIDEGAEQWLYDCYGYLQGVDKQDNYGGKKVAGLSPHNYLIFINIGTAFLTSHLGNLGIVDTVGAVSSMDLPPQGVFHFGPADSFGSVVSAYDSAFVTAEAEAADVANRLLRQDARRGVKSDGELGSALKSSVKRHAATLAQRNDGMIAELVEEGEVMPPIVEDDVEIEDLDEGEVRKLATRESKSDGFLPVMGDLTAVKSGADASDEVVGILEQEKLFDYSARDLMIGLSRGAVSSEKARVGGWIERIRDFVFGESDPYIFEADLNEDDYSVLTPKTNDDWNQVDRELDMAVENVVRIGRGLKTTRTATATRSLVIPSASPSVSSSAAETGSISSSKTQSDSITISSSISLSGSGSPSFTSAPSTSVSSSTTISNTASSSPASSFSVSVTNSPTESITATPTHSVSVSHSITGTPTISITPTASSSNSASDSASVTPTITTSPTGSVKLSFSLSPAVSVSVTVTSSPTPTTSIITVTPSGTTTKTITSTPTSTTTETKTVTPRNSATSSDSATVTASESSSQTASSSKSVTPTITRTTTETVSTSPTPTITVSVSEIRSVSLSASESVSLTKSESATYSLTPTKSPTLTRTPTSSMSASATETPSVSYTRSPTPTFTTSESKSVSKSGSETKTTTETITRTASPTPSTSASKTPSVSETATPTVSVTSSITKEAETPTTTRSSTYSVTTSESASPTASATPTVTAVVSSSLSTTKSPDGTPSKTRSGSISKTATKSGTETSTTTASTTYSPTGSFTQSKTATSTLSPTGTRSPTVTTTNTMTVDASASISPTVTIVSQSKSFSSTGDISSSVTYEITAHGMTVSAFGSPTVHYQAKPGSTIPVWAIITAVIGGLAVAGVVGEVARRDCNKRKAEVRRRLTGEGPDGVEIVGIAQFSNTATPNPLRFGISGSAPSHTTPAPKPPMTPRPPMSPHVAPGPTAAPVAIIVEGQAFSGTGVGIDEEGSRPNSTIADHSDGKDHDEAVESRRIRAAKTLRGNEAAKERAAETMRIARAKNEDALKQERELKRMSKMTATAKLTEDAKDKREREVKVAEEARRVELGKKIHETSEDQKLKTAAQCLPERYRTAQRTIGSKGRLLSDAISARMNERAREKGFANYEAAVVLVERYAGSKSWDKKKDESTMQNALELMILEYRGIPTQALALQKEAIDKGMHPFLVSKSFTSYSEALEKVEGFLIAKQQEKEAAEKAERDIAVLATERAVAEVERVRRAEISARKAPPNVPPPVPPAMPRPPIDPKLEEYLRQNPEQIRAEDARIAREKRLEEARERFGAEDALAKLSKAERIERNIKAFDNLSSKGVFRGRSDPVRQISLLPRQGAADNSNRGKAALEIKKAGLFKELEDAECQRKLDEADRNTTLGSVLRDIFKQSDEQSVTAAPFSTLSPLMASSYPRSPDKQFTTAASSSVTNPLASLTQYKTSVQVGARVHDRVSSSVNSRGLAIKSLHRSRASGVNPALLGAPYAAPLPGVPTAQPSGAVEPSPRPAPSKAKDGQQVSAALQTRGSSPDL